MPRVNLAKFEARRAKIEMQAAHWESVLADWRKAGGCVQHKPRNVDTNVDVPLSMLYRYATSCPACFTIYDARIKRASFVAQLERPETIEEGTSEDINDET